MATLIDYYLNNNCISDAIDQALEAECLDSVITCLDTIVVKTSEEDFNELIYKIGSYLLSCASYLTDPDDEQVRKFVVQLYCKYNLWIEACIVTLSNEFNQPSNSIETILRSCSSANQVAIAKQIACILNRQLIYLHNYPDGTLKSLMSTSKTLSLFKYTAKEVDCLASYNLKDSLPDFLITPFMFGYHNSRFKRSPSRVVMLHAANGFANVAYGKDVLISGPILRPRMLFGRCGIEAVSGVIGSIGLINLWNPEVAFNLTLNKLRFYPDTMLKAGSMLACSLSRSGYRGDDELDDFLDCPEFDCIEKASLDEQVCSVVGLGVAYSGTNNHEALFILRRLMRNDSIPLILKGLCGLSIGLIAVSTACHKVATCLVTTLLQLDTLINRPEELVTSWYICLSVGLIYLQRKSKPNVNKIMELINKLSSKKLRSMLKLTLNCCAYAGSGDVLQIQKLLQIISKPADVRPGPDTSTVTSDSPLPSTSKLSPFKSRYASSSEQPRPKRRKYSVKPSPTRRQVYSKQYLNKTRRRVRSSLDTRSLPTKRDKQPDTTINNDNGAILNVKGRLIRLNEFNSIDDVIKKIGSKVKRKNQHDNHGHLFDNTFTKTPRKVQRYSFRRLSLPSSIYESPRDSSERYDNSPILHSDDESDRPSSRTTSSDRLSSSMSLLESLESLSYTLDKVMNEKQQQRDPSKANVTPLSSTPPRLVNHSIATIGISLIAMGEEIGTSMAKRMLQQILINGTPSSKRMAPLAFALLSLSIPEQQIISTLDKCARNQMISQSINSIIATGLCGAGSLDAKLSKVIDKLFEHYDAGPAPCLDALILTKGLLHLGKGLMTLNPFSYDDQIIYPAGLASILVIIFSCFDVRHTLLGGRLNQLIYYLTPAIRPRYIVTLDEETLEPVEVTMGIGQALSIHEQVGKLRLSRVNSSQNSPIVLKDQEKAEIHSDQYKSVGKIVEGLVIVEKNA